ARTGTSSDMVGQDNAPTTVHNDVQGAVNPPVDVALPPAINTATATPNKRGRKPAVAKTMDTKASAPLSQDTIDVGTAPGPLLKPAGKKRGRKPKVTKAALLSDTAPTTVNSGAVMNPPAPTTKSGDAASVASVI
ncbi:hypothetical protein HYPSUDRAFT_60385, partial [Hypholoma sublateritium FD-334 SS-4]